jgi:hypothetical protein
MDILEYYPDFFAVYTTFQTNIENKEKVVAVVTPDYSEYAFHEYGDKPGVYSTSNPTDWYYEEPQTWISATNVKKTSLTALNEMNAIFKHRNIKMYYSYGAINRNIVFPENLTPSSLQLLDTTLDSNLDFPLISSMSDYIYLGNYFFDRNSLLNSNKGRVAMTQQLIADLKAYLGGQ